MSTLCRSQQVVYILNIMRWTTSLWEEFLMMNYTLLLLLLMQMKRIFQLSLWLMVTMRKGFVWRLLHHIFAMSMKSCKPSCPFYIFLPLFMNCCVSRWEIRTVVRPVFEQVSSYFYFIILKCCVCWCFVMALPGPKWTSLCLEWSHGYETVDKVYLLEQIPLERSICFIHLSDKLFMRA